MRAPSPGSAPATHPLPAPPTLRALYEPYIAICFPYFIPLDNFARLQLGAGDDYDKLSIASLRARLNDEWDIFVDRHDGDVERSYCEVTKTLDSPASKADIDLIDLRLNALQHVNWASCEIMYAVSECLVWINSP